MLIAVQKQRKESVDREQPTPEKQRAFLAGPQRRELIEGRQGAIAVLRHVGHRKIVGEEKILEAADGECYKAEDGHACVTRTFLQERLAGYDPRNSGGERVNGSEERQKK